MSIGRTPAVLGRRACAVLAAGSAALHGVMLSHGGSAALMALMATMMIACLFCARDLWQRGALRVWCAVALMNLAMIAVHMPMPGHQHGAALAGPHQTSTLMGAATLLALIEVMLAAAVLIYRTRGRSVTAFVTSG
ncbi:hypothetical protein M2272_005074 [Mycobacterium frederiksbergense]|uniref:Uncharacterized protein n=1 Tax=Mycolicibacterium frederiksbergense TaxID=117567 RepID=A0ABT6L7S2_9MYCO|nr:hypothetical protein [Mycolicibacterium frederiksbergense]MDH6198415.1 hypothetical protein [Mycolicibacterium frederiksbergense]